MVRFLRKAGVSGGAEAVKSVVPTEGPLHHGQTLQGSDGLTKEFQWPVIILWMSWLVGMVNVWLGWAIRGVNAMPRTVFMYGLSAKKAGEHHVISGLDHKATLPTTNNPIPQPFNRTTKQPTAQPNSQPLSYGSNGQLTSSYGSNFQLTSVSYGSNGQPDSHFNRPFDLSTGQPEVESRDSAYKSAGLMARKPLNSLVNQ